MSFYGFFTKKYFLTSCKCKQGYLLGMIKKLPHEMYLLHSCTNEVARIQMWILNLEHPTIDSQSYLCLLLMKAPVSSSLRN